MDFWKSYNEDGPVFLLVTLGTKVISEGILYFQPPWQLNADTHLISFPECF